jgi:hypothetical protein
VAWARARRSAYRRSPLSVGSSALIMGRRSLAGSNIGDIAEAQELLDSCGEHKFSADVEVIPIQRVNEAHGRMFKGDVKYRLTIDVAHVRSGRSRAAAQSLGSNKPCGVFGQLP